MHAGPGASGAGDPDIATDPQPRSPHFRRVPQNAAFVFLSRVAGAASSTAILAIAAHRLDAEDFGLVVSVMAGGFIANAVITFGTDTLVTRAVAGAEPGAGALVRSALRLQVGAAVMLIAGAGVAAGMGAPGVLLIEAVAMLPLAVVTVAGAVVRGTERMQPVFVAAAAASVASLVALLVGFSIGEGPIVPIGARGIGSLVAAVVLWVAAKPPQVAPAGPDEPSSAALGVDMIGLVRRATPFAAMVVLAALGTQASLLIVEFLVDEPAGGYGAAIRLLEAARLVPAAVIAAVFPTLVAGPPDLAGHRRWRRVLGAYGVASMLTLIVIAEPANRLVFDDQPSGTALIRILAVAMPLTVLRLQLSFEAIAEHRERSVVASAALGTTLLLVLGAALAGPFGSQGVAWAQVAGVGLAAFVLVVTRSRSASSANEAGQRAT